MSDFDEMDFDDLYENEEQITPEEVFKTVLINKPKGVKLDVELVDSNGDTIDLTNLIVELIDYIEEKLNDPEGNQFSDQIMPLISKSIVSVLGRICGVPITAFLLSNPNTKMGVVYSMGVAFLLLKYVQKHNLKIVTYEEEISEQEITDFENKVQENEIAVMGAMMGMDPQEILQKLKESGKINEEDISALVDDSSVDEDKEED